jgi:hypothetical protein
MKEGRGIEKSQWILLYKIPKKKKWRAICSCGRFYEVDKTNVTRGKSKSCQKCKGQRLSQYTNFKTHGLSKKYKDIYELWASIKRRCYNKKQKTYKYYGGKGIIICDEWKNDFPEFLKWCLNNGYRKKLEIDRINSNGNYAPDNCQFITKSENIRKAFLGKKHNLERRIKNCLSKTNLVHNDLIEIFKMAQSGKYKQKEIASKYGINRHTVQKILKRANINPNYRKRG